MTFLASPKVERLVRFILISANARRLAAFCNAAFGCRTIATAHHAGPAFESSLQVEGGAESITLGLGKETIEILQFDRPGRPYPAGKSAADMIFQHFAVGVTDMAQAYDRLSAVPGWSAISTAGPQRLPDSSGGATAFKFRDPDGHPLELLALPDRPASPGKAVCFGIDHSAISVRDSDRSIAFYQGLGLEVAQRSLNRGPEQELLDGVLDPHVEVTALVPRQRTPHVELLRYRSGAPDSHVFLDNNDVAATRLVFEAQADVSPIALSHVGGPEFDRQVLDPDGHRLVIARPDGTSEKREDRQ